MFKEKGLESNYNSRAPGESITVQFSSNTTQTTSPFRPRAMRDSSIASCIASHQRLRSQRVSVVRTTVYLSHISISIWTLRWLVFFKGKDGEADVLQSRLVSSISIHDIGYWLGCDIFAGRYLGILGFATGQGPGLNIVVKIGICLCCTRWGSCCEIKEVNRCLAAGCVDAAFMASWVEWIVTEFVRDRCARVARDTGRTIICWKWFIVVALD